MAKKVRSPKLFKATHDGELRIGDAVIPCAVLEDGTRVLTQRGVLRALGRSDNVRGSDGGDKLPPFLRGKAIKPFISNDLLLATAPLKFIPKRGAPAHGFRADLLPMLCEVFLQAREEGVLQHNQHEIAQKCEILMRALAHVGITALVDEATGYQFDREHNALRLLLQAYVAEGVRDWVKTFKDSFFDSLDRLYGNEKTVPHSRPLYYGKFINKYVYDPLENGYVKEELDRKNIEPSGKRKVRFHQWLTGHGKQELVSRIGKVEGVMASSSDLSDFKEKVEKLPHVNLLDLRTSID